jgi:outer membrane protein TolC
MGGLFQLLPGGYGQDLPPGFLGERTPEKKPTEPMNPPTGPLTTHTATPSVAVNPPAPLDTDRPLPITLATALQLASARPVDIAVARERVRVAAAQLDRARVLWLPTIYVGADYARHDGRLQDSPGNILDTSRQSLMLGAGPVAVFALADACFAPLAARQVVAARQAGVQAAANDSLLAVAEAYFTVQQARGELAGAEDAARRAAELVRRVEHLAEGLAAPVEANRARTELARRRQAVQAARERWRTASADLTRLLRLDAAALVEPQEPPHLQVTLVPLDRTVDELIPIGLTYRPELAAQQALVRAALARLRQERLRPLVPSILLRGNATNPAGNLAGGVFGGGLNDSMNNFGARGDFDVQVLWEFQNLGFGNHARVAEQRAEHRLAVLESFRLQDQVAAEVARAHAQARSAAARLADAEAGLKEAVATAKKSFEGLGETRRAGNLIVLLVRPQEAVAAVQSLSLTYADYYGALADYNRAQFRLYRALGQPAQLVLGCESDIKGE